MLVKAIDRHVQWLTDQKITTFNAYDAHRPELMQALDSGFAGIDGPIVIEDSGAYSPSEDIMDIHSRVTDMGLAQPWVILTSDFNVSANMKNMMFYPYYVIDTLVTTVTTDVDIIKPRNHGVGFIFNRAYSPRVISVVKMYQQPWFNSSLIKFPVQEVGIDGLEEHEKSIIGEICKTLPWGVDTGGTHIDIEHPGFTDCYINFMVESNYPNALVSEKSIKPFMAGQIPCVLGHTNLTKLLTGWGFDMMENYNYMSPSDDIRIRLDKLIVQLTEILEHIDQVWHETLPARKHNYEWVRSPDFVNMLQQELREWVNG